MDEARTSTRRPNGAVVQLPSATGSQSVSNRRPSTMSADTDSPDLAQFRLTRIVGEAAYQYGKMREAEHERRLADLEYQKQFQHFENNAKLREAVEARRNKADRLLHNARSEYTRAARESEPLLNRLNSEPSSPNTAEESARPILQKELKGYVRLRDMDDEIHKMERRIQNELPHDVRGLVSREMKNYTHKNDYDRLAEQVKNLSVRGPQLSESRDTSRERNVDSSITTNSPDLETLKTDLTTQTSQLNTEMSSLKEALAIVQKDILKLRFERMESGPDPRPDEIPMANNITSLQSALEKAQEVMNDQYATIHDFRLQISGVVDGIRVLNERVEEYEQRLDGVQSSTQRFFVETTLENEKRNTVLADLFDDMYNKIKTDISAKLESGAFPSPQAKTVRPAVPPNLPNNNPVAVAQPTASALPLAVIVNNQVKIVHDLHAQLQGLQTQFFQYRQLVTQNFEQIVAQFNQIYEELNGRIAILDQSRAELREKIQNLDYTVTRISVRLQTHAASTENNFKDTAIHMDSVKKRFAEHRAILDSMITSWRNLACTTDELEGKYESLKEFLSSKVMPTFSKMRKMLPELSEGGADDAQSLNSPSDGDRSGVPGEIKQNGEQLLLKSGEDGDASNPIEV